MKLQARLDLPPKDAVAFFARKGESIAWDWTDVWRSQNSHAFTVAKVTDIKGPGAKSIDVEGWSTEVTQKADDKTTKYRVGVVAAGPKVAFLFLNPLDDLDLTADQFDVITLRSGQRASQVN